MLATKLKGQITQDGRLVVRIPSDMATGQVDVILLHRTTSSAKRRARHNTPHPGFGIWAKRSDITDSATFAASLRQIVETHSDGKPRQ